MVTVEMDDDEARQLSESISDLLCWIRGYLAARPDDVNNPFGHEAVRDFRIKLNSAMRHLREVSNR